MNSKRQDSNPHSLILETILLTERETMLTKSCPFIRHLTSSAGNRAPTLRPWPLPLSSGLLPEEWQSYPLCLRKCSRKLKKIRGICWAAAPQVRLTSCCASQTEGSNNWRLKEDEPQALGSHSNMALIQKSSQQEGAETTPNKELLKELETFNLEKKKLRRQESYAPTAVCSPRKRDEPCLMAPTEGIHTKAKKLISVRAQSCVKRNGLARLRTGI